MAFGGSCRNWNERLDRVFEAEEHPLVRPMPRLSGPLDGISFSGRGNLESERSLSYAMQVRSQVNKPTLGGREWTKVDKVNPLLEEFGENVKASNKKDIDVKTENENKPKGIAGKQKQAKEKKGGEKDTPEGKGPVLDDKDHSFINFCNLHVNLMIARLGRF